METGLTVWKTIVNWNVNLGNKGVEEMGDKAQAIGLLILYVFAGLGGGWLLSNLLIGSLEWRSDYRQLKRQVEEIHTGVCRNAIPVGDDRVRYDCR